MTQTPNLAIAHIAAAQNQKEVTANDAFDRLDRALTDGLEVDLAAADVTLTAAQFREHVAFRCTGALPDRKLLVPPLKRLFLVSNASAAHPVLVARGATEIEVGPAQTFVLYADGTADGLVGAGGAPGATSFLGLDDTPASFAGAGGYLLAVALAENGLQFVPIEGSPQSWAVPFRGALVYRDSALTGVTFPRLCPHTHALYDSDRFWLGPSVDFTVDTATDTLSAAGHGLATGDGPFYLRSSGTLPGGLGSTTKYWAIRVDENTLQLATSRADALAATAVALSSAGSGTHTLAKGETLRVPAGITKVRLVAQMRTNDTTTAGSLLVTFQKNENSATTLTETLGGTRWHVRTGTSGFTGNWGFIVSAPLPVSADDLFAVRVNVSGLGTQNTLQANVFFALEVVETDEPSRILPALEEEGGDAGKLVHVDDAGEAYVLNAQVTVREDGQLRVGTVPACVAEDTVNEAGIIVAPFLTDHALFAVTGQGSGGVGVFELSREAGAANTTLAEVRARWGETIVGRFRFLTGVDPEAQDSGGFTILTRADGDTVTRAKLRIAAANGFTTIGTLPAGDVRVAEAPLTIDHNVGTSYDPAAADWQQSVGAALQVWSSVNSVNAQAQVILAKRLSTERTAARLVNPAGGNHSRLAFVVQEHGQAPFEAMRLTHTGRLGVMTDNPAETLHVNGGARITGDLQVGGGEVAIDADRVLRLRSYTVATVPDAASKGAGATVFVSNGAAGEPVVAFSDGAEWRRCDTGAAIGAA